MRPSSRRGWPIDAPSPRTCGPCSTEWTRGFVALNTIEQALSDLIDARGTGTVERSPPRTDDEAIAMLEPDDILVDCTGLARCCATCSSRATTTARATEHVRFRLEYALVVTFLYGQHYACNEYCKYYKNRENAGYKFIPAVHRTSYDGAVSHVTASSASARPSTRRCRRRSTEPGCASSSPPSPSRWTGSSTRSRRRPTARSSATSRSSASRSTSTTHGTRPAGGGSVGRDHPLAAAPVFLLGDSAIGSPYFQSISLGLECAFFLAGHMANRALPMAEIFDRYELFMYQQWMRVYMRTQMIKHNKDLLESVDDTMGLLAKLHVY